MLWSAGSGVRAGEAERRALRTDERHSVGPEGVSVSATSGTISPLAGGDGLFLSTSVLWRLWQLPDPLCNLLTLAMIQLVCMGTIALM